MLQAVINGLVLGFALSPTCPSSAEEIRIGTKAGFSGALLVGPGAVTGDAFVLAFVLLGLPAVLQTLPKAFSRAAVHVTLTHLWE